MKQQTQHFTPPAPEELRSLATRFLEGATTTGEEQRLYGGFASWPAGSLPQDLENMRAMFMWYAGLPARNPAPHRRSRAPWLATAAALAVLVAVGIGALLLRTGAERRATADSYTSFAGSYIQRNGQRIDNLPVIYDEIVAAEQLGDSLSRQYSDSALIERALRGVSDPDQAAQIRTIIFE